MTEKLFTFLGGLPFFLMVQNPNGRNVQFNWTRLFEALVIAILGGVLAGYIAVQKIEVQIEVLTKQVDRIQYRLDEHVVQSIPRKR